VGGPLVSVVIPTRNRLALLQEAVGSVTSQSLNSWELIVVDDASQDGTWNWLSSLASPSIRAVRLVEHRERSAGRNRGLEEARGDFILFLDDDDRLRFQALERLVRALKSDKDAVAAVGGRLAFDSHGHRSRGAHPRVALRRYVWSEALVGWVAISGQTLFRRAAVLQAGGWDERLVSVEDQELWLRVSRLGPVRFIPHIVLENRVHHGGQWRPADAASVEEEFRKSHVACLPESEQRVGQRLLSARHWFKEANRDFGAEMMGRSLRNQLRAIRFAPRLLVSPVVGPGLATNVLKCFVALVIGSTCYDVLRRARAAGRRLLRWDAGAGATVTIQGSAKR